MACSKCNTQNTNCGCSDSALTTNPNTLQSTLCPTPIPCSEYVNAACVYLNDGIFDGAIDPGTSLEEIIQQLILMITNPECTDTDSCNCPGGGGTTGNNGLTADTPSNVQLGGTLLKDTTINNGIYTLDITGTNAVPNNWGVLRVKNTNITNGSVALYAESVAAGTNSATAYFKSTGTINANLLVETTGANSISSITARHSATSTSNSHAAIIANATNINGPTALVAQTANTGLRPAFRAIKDYASYSGVQNVVSITTKGNGSNGGGSALYYEHVGSTGATSIETNRLESVWKDSTVASYATTFRLTGTNASGSGQNTLIEIDSDVAAGTLFRIMNALPTSPAGLAAGSLYTQTATEIGGSGTTKVICIV